MEKKEDKFNSGETIYLDKTGKKITERKYRELQGIPDTPEVKEEPSPLGETVERR